VSLSSVGQEIAAAVADFVTGIEPEAELAVAILDAAFPALLPVLPAALVGIRAWADAQEKAMAAAAAAPIAPTVATELESAAEALKRS
jgi:hypothetical protein